MTGSSVTSPYSDGDVQNACAVLGFSLIAQYSPNSCKNAIGFFSSGDAPYSSTEDQGLPL
jgi:hypothetical protein